MITEKLLPAPRTLALAEEATGLYLDTLPPRWRLRARPGSAYAAAVAVACDRSAPRDACHWIRREVGERVLADLVDPADPVDNPLVVEYATELAREVLERFAVGRGDRYGNAVIEPEAAPGFAAEALIAWGKAESQHPGCTDNVWAYVRTVVRNLVAHDLDAATRQLHPGERAARRLAARLLREMKINRPERAGAAARQDMLEAARVRLRAHGGYVERADDPEVVNRLPGGPDPQEEAQVRALLDRIRGLLSGPRYTSVDRQTWAHFEAAGLTGRDIPWPDYGVAPHTGAQRLLALLRKLARDLEDWHQAYA
jgi:hypothetical protein